MHVNPYLEMNQEMDSANIFDILAKNTDKDKQNKARVNSVAQGFGSASISCGYGSGSRVLK